MAAMVTMGGPHTKLNVKRTGEATVIAVENIRIAEREPSQRASLTELT